MRHQAGDDLGIVFGAFSFPGLDHFGGESRTAGGGDPERIAAVRYHDGDTGIRQASLGDGIDDSKKVRPTAGKQDPQAVHSGRFQSHVYNTLRSPLTVRPMTQNFSPARSSIDFVRLNLSAGTAAMSPMPILKVRNISSGSTLPSCCR